MDGAHNLTATATDTAGNTSAASSVLAVTIDTAAPTVIVNIVDAALSTADTTSAVNFVFSEVPVGFSNTDITVVGGTLSAVTQNLGIDSTGKTWTATFTAINGIATTGSVTVNAGTYSDAAGNVGSGGADNVAIDTANPTLTVNIVDNQLNDSDTSSVVTFTFSEVPVGFVETDISIGAGLSLVAGSLAIDPADLTGKTYKATVSATDGFAGTPSVSVAGAGYTDAAGNSGGNGSDMVAVDRVNPAVTSVTLSDSALTTGETATVTVTFSEAVTGFDVADLTYDTTSATIGVFATSDNITWTATLTPTANVTDNTNVITVKNTGWSDLASNAGTGATSANYTVNTATDNQGPTGVTFTLDLSTVSSFESGSTLPSGAAMGTVVAIGDPNSTVFTYSLVDTDALHVISTLFAINPTTGVLSTAGAVGAGTYTFNLIATDQATNASPPVAVTVTVDGSGNANLSLGSGLDIAYGLNGNDTIIGGDGNDVLIGGQNNDSLTGGAGVDSLRGGGNNDNFIFDDGDSGVGALADIIQDFGNGSDRINLTAIDSNINSANDQNFLSASANSATVANSVTWHYDAGTNRTIIHGDVNGNTTADFEIILLGNIALASGDFIL